MNLVFKMCWLRERQKLKLMGRKNINDHLWILMTYIHNYCEEFLIYFIYCSLPWKIIDNLFNQVVFVAMELKLSESPGWK